MSARPVTPSASTTRSAASIAQAGARIFKKLVLENYEDPGDERRGAERQQVIGEVTVSVTGQSGATLGDTQAFVRDSSRTGCGLWSRINMPAGSTVMITAMSPEGKPIAQRLGRVRHCRGAEGTGFAVGVMFDSEAQMIGKAL
jgi:hypothetical protein